MTGSEHRVIQIHPTRRCNLRCLHCYSSSGPALREVLPHAGLCALLDDAAAEGFDTLSVSGGEPLLYRPLAAVLAHARQLGMLTLLTTNGTVTTPRLAARLADVTDLIAVSLDGAPESHDRMRNSPGAFQRMAERLTLLREHRIRFGFIFTLTQHNLHELPWVAEFALDQGATLLQIHPLEGAGRAASGFAGTPPDEIEAAHAYLEALYVQARVGEAMLVQLDLADRTALREAPPSEVPPGTRLADIVSPVVLEDDGTLVPLQYGFPRQFAIGSLQSACLRELVATWMRRTAPGFVALCRRVAEAEATNADALPFFNWYARVAAAARSPGSMREAHPRVIGRFPKKEGPDADVPMSER